MYGSHVKEIYGGEHHTTNQRMELTAAIEGLKALKEPCKVKLYSDSAYLVNAFQQQWYTKWEQNGWKNSTGKPVANQELWEQLLNLTRKHEVTFFKVKGHADDQWNTRCDELAVAAIPR
jgi:ribonuclease HI